MESTSNLVCCAKKCSNTFPSSGLGDLNFFLKNQAVKDRFKLSGNKLMVKGHISILYVIVLKNIVKEELKEKEVNPPKRLVKCF